MKISWLRLLAAGALYVALANCSNSDSSGSGNNTNNTCNAYTSSESSACTSCVSSSCQTQITAAQPACNAFVACVCAANGSVSACQTQLNENGCSALANSVQSCAQSNCSTSCTGTSSGGSSGSSSGSSNGCPTGQPAPACASNADCTGGMQHHQLQL